MGHRLLDIALEAHKPEARQARVRRHQHRLQPGNGKPLARLKGQWPRLSRTPSRLSQPQLLAVARGEIEDERADVSLCGQASGQRRALVYHQQVTHLKKDWKVLKLGV